MPTQAKAVRIHGAGGPDVLKIEPVVVRDPGPSEVLVEVQAAGLNRADILQRRGVYPAPPGVAPDIPGLELTGVVREVGQGVTRIAPGQRVMAIVAGAGMASHAVLHERELISVPDGLSVEEAAAIPEVFMTAYDAICLQGRLTLGDHLLIHAVGSGVGTAALQLALAMGATPIGTSRSDGKLARARELGLRHGVLTADGTFAARVAELSGGRLCEVVLDTVGAKYLTENVKAVAPSGTVVVIGLLGGVKGELPLGLLLAKRASVVGSVLRSRPLEEKIALAQSFAHHVMPLFERGALRPIVDSVLPMEAVAEAHEKLESNDTFGKVVLRWS